jgi:hypothetical protein
MKIFILLFCFGINRTLYAQSIDNQLVLKPDSVDFQSIRDAHAGDACVATDFKRRMEHPSENLSRKMDNLFTVQPGQRTISPAKVSTTDWFLERNAANFITL